MPCALPPSCLEHGQRPWRGEKGSPRIVGEKTSAILWECPGPEFLLYFARLGRGDGVRETPIREGMAQGGLSRVKASTR